jgi:hypothetical protein
MSSCPHTHPGICYETTVGGYYEIQYCKSCGEEISKVFIPDKTGDYGENKYPLCGDYFKIEDM